MDLLLITGIPIILGVGYLLWKFCFDHGATGSHDNPARRREDARDWQRRFGPGSVLATNFLQPTQNEILETLHMLDHLMPGWEKGLAGETESVFLNELALNFPTLRKPKCLFPPPRAETSHAPVRPMLDPTALRAKADDIATKRQAFQARRAQLNALEQIVGGTPADHPSDKPSFPALEGARGQIKPLLWPALLTAAVLVAAVFTGVRNVPKAVKATSMGLETTTTVPPAASPPKPVVAEPSLAPAIAVTEPVAKATPASTPAPAVVTTSATPPVRPSATPDSAKMALDRQIAASKQRAVSKYPALAVEGSEINLRFVFRYKALVLQNSPRLLDPRWPEQLVDECAAASGASPKHDTFTRVLGTPR